jgi:SPOR domain
MRWRLLRWFVAAALLANLGYAAWSRGALAVIGWAPATERDPGRLEQQVRPTALRVLTAEAAAAATAGLAAVGPPPPAAAITSVTPAASAPAAAASAAPPASAAQASVSDAGGRPLVCLEVGPLDNNSAAVESVERTLAGVLPDRLWARDVRPGGAQYAVFVGPINSREAARQRREELVKLKMSFEAIELPGGEQGGYSLGRHGSEAAAQAALDGFRERGLRNARVMLVREPGPRVWLRLDALNATQADAVRAFSPSQLGGTAASACVVGSVMSVTAPR